MSILLNENRIGNFTSSEIFKLTKKDKSGKRFGVPAMKYIRQTKDERLLETSIDSEIEAKPLAWGKLLEPIVHNMLGLDYTFCSDETLMHPTINYWGGSKDGTHEGEHRAIAEYKAPFTKDSFVQLVRPLYQGLTGIEAMYAIKDGYNYEGFEYPEHSDGEKFYFQCISNAIINKCDYAELIVFMPYQSQLIEINQLAMDSDGRMLPQYKWLEYSAIPFIKEGGFFKNLNVIRFKIPDADKELLTECVLKGGELLIPFTRQIRIT